MNEIIGSRRNYDDGVTLCDGPIRVRLFPDCITISVHNEEGILKILPFIDIVQQTNNVECYKDAFGEIFLVEVYFTEAFKDDGLEGVNT